MSELTRTAIMPLLRLALREDQAQRDLTSRAVLSAGTRITAAIVAKASGILAGGQVAAWTFSALDASLRCRVHIRDGARLKPGDRILTVQGDAATIFAAERTALNFLGHLSGIATLTQAYVQKIRGTHARIYDTRKTLPGLRFLEKYAVRIGGGMNHRMSLNDAILIKTNHIRVLEHHSRFCGFPEPARGYMVIREAIAKARAVRPKRLVAIEATSSREFSHAYRRSSADVVLLDNWSLKEIREAVAFRRAMSRRWGPIELEVSGGVTLSNVRAIAKTGVDRISIGRLTHSAASLDMSLRVIR